MKCMQCSRFESVPGCTGEGGGYDVPGTDVCYSTSTPTPSVPSTPAPTPPTTTPGICNIIDLMGQTIFFSASNICWRLQLYAGGVLEGDLIDPTCSNNESDFTSSGIFSIAGNVNTFGNAAAYIPGSKGYSGRFKFKEGAVLKPSAKVVAWNPSTLIYEVELTIPTCSKEAVCPVMRV